MSDFKQQAKRAGRIYIDAKISMLTDLQKEIEVEGYLNVAQVKGSISTWIELLKGVKKSHE